MLPPRMAETTETPARLSAPEEPAQGVLRGEAGTRVALDAVRTG